LRKLTALLTGILLSTQLMAFSSPPYQPVDWSTSETPAEDAEYAVENKDMRLLGFALRGYHIPGVKAADRQLYIDKCGIRVLEGFGDVIRDETQASDMKRASAYAREYNAVIIAKCMPATP